MTGFLRSLARRNEQRATVTAHPRDPVLAAWFAGASDSSVVTAETALRSTAVYACVNLISETLAQLPLHVYARDGLNRSKATDHKLYRIVHDQPAPGITSFEWRESLISSTVLQGDAFARIILNGDGSVRALPIIAKRDMRITQDQNGLPIYHWRQRTPTGTLPERVLFDHEVLRLPFHLDGVQSLSPIAVHKATIGNVLDATKYTTNFIQNSAQPRGAIATKDPVSDEAAATLRRDWEERHQGPANVGKIAIFDGGMEWQQIGLSQVDAQYIETQSFSVGDIARIFLCPPHKIGDLSKATFSNIEHEGIAFVVGTILRWVRRTESRFNQYLLSATDRRLGFNVAYDLKGLLRGDAKSRGELYKALFYLGAIKPNEIRAAEDLNSYDGGERFYLQGATVPVDMIDQAVAKRIDKAPEST